MTFTGFIFNQMCSSTRVSTQVIMSQHESTQVKTNQHGSTRVQNESTRFNMSLTRV